MKKYVFDVDFGQKGKNISFWSKPDDHDVLYTVPFVVDYEHAHYMIDYSRSYRITFTELSVNQERYDSAVITKKGGNIEIWIMNTTFSMKCDKDCPISIEDDKSHYFDIKISSSPLCSGEDITKNATEWLKSHSEENPPKVTSAYIPSSVSHPSHYQRFGMECIDAMVKLFGNEEVKSFCKLNSFKYRWRAGNKGDAKEDIDKAEWYEKKEKEL